MPKTRKQKEESVEILIKKITDSKAVVFTDYKGMTMKQLSDLRDQLRDQTAELIVTKNTLLKIALAKAVDRNATPSPAIFENPTATLFAYDDEITPIKSLVKALKDNAIGHIKAGFLGNQLLDESKIKQLAGLPSKDELRGKVVGVLVAPISGLQSVLFGNIRNLVYALEQIRKSKGGEQ